MINIQKSYSVHIGSIRFILSSSVQFDPISSIQFYVVYYVHQSSIQSNLVQFNPHCLYLVHTSPILSTSILSSLFCPLWSYSVHTIHFDPTQSNPVHFGPIRPLFSTLVLFGSICPLWSYSIHFGLVCPIQSYSV